MCSGKFKPTGISFERVLVDQSSADRVLKVPFATNIPTGKIILLVILILIILLVILILIILLVKTQ